MGARWRARLYIPAQPDVVPWQQYGGMIDVQEFRRRLLDLESRAVTRTGRAMEAAGIGRDTVHDSGDASHATAAASEQFTEAELSAGTLGEIRAALGRIDAGTFGACAVDGAPIEEARLAAVPWAAHCLAHAEQAEAAADDTMPTL